VYYIDSTVFFEEANQLALLFILFFVTVYLLFVLREQRRWLRHLSHDTTTVAVALGFFHL
jgi:hypothetical protein